MALSDGKNVLVDVDLRPSLNDKGILSENKNGTWHVMCVQPSEFQKNEETAHKICKELGFSGYSFHKVTQLTKKDETKKQREAKLPHSIDLNRFSLNSRFLSKRSNQMNDFLNGTPDDLKDGIHYSELIVGGPAGCLVLHVECVPHSAVPILIPMPDAPPPSKDPEKPVKPIEPIIQPDKIPTVIVPSDPNTEEDEIKPPHIAGDDHFPWSANIFINGNLSCNGVLLERFWALVESSCVQNIE